LPSVGWDLLQGSDLLSRPPDAWDGHSSDQNRGDADPDDTVDNDVREIEVHRIVGGGRSYNREDVEEQKFKGI